MIDYRQLRNLNLTHQEVAAYAFDLADERTIDKVRSINEPYLSSLIAELKNYDSPSFRQEIPMIIKAMDRGRGTLMALYLSNRLSDSGKKYLECEHYGAQPALDEHVLFGRSAKEVILTGLAAAGSHEDDPTLPIIAPKLWRVTKVMQGGFIQLSVTPGEEVEPGVYDVKLIGEFGVVAAFAPVEVGPGLEVRTLKARLEVPATLESRSLDLPTDVDLESVESAQAWLRGHQCYVVVLVTKLS